MFAIDRMNRDVLAPIGIRIGLWAFDTCDSDSIAMRSFQPFQLTADCTTTAAIRPPCAAGKQRLYALIGSVTSTTASYLAKSGFTSCVPVVSSYASSRKIPTLPLVATTAALNNIEADAITAVLLALNVSSFTLLTISQDNADYSSDLT